MLEIESGVIIGPNHLIINFKRGKNEEKVTMPTKIKYFLVNFQVVISSEIEKSEIIFSKAWGEGLDSISNF